MSGWQVGDLALCIKSGSSPDNSTRAGRVYTVERVWTNPVSGKQVLDFVGIFNGHPSRSVTTFWGHYALRFRKVTPGTDIEGVEERRRIAVGEPA